MYGWMGTILRINLSTEEIRMEPLHEATARDFIGGRGFNSRTLFNEIPKHIDPLGEQNIITLAPGALTGTPLGLTSRMEITTLSPLSNILGDGNAGGKFPYILKRAGYDQIIITGRAKTPKYIFIDDGNIALKDASALWGKTTWQATDELHKWHGNDVQVACIGQAGENLVRFATIIVDKYASGTPGSGAVFGSKNLKAIACRGTGKVKLAKSDEFRKMAAKDKNFLLKDHEQRHIVAVYGTHIGMDRWHPIYRYCEKVLSSEEVPNSLRADAWKQYETGRTGCYGCFISCKNKFRIPSGRRKGERGEALEYETISCMGTNCGIDDPLVVLEMGNLADAYGMDSIAAGFAIAFAKELYNRGIIKFADTGLRLDWENAESQVELIHRIALREGFGNLVAEGMYGLAKLIGKGAMDFCYHVKGLSRGVYPPGLFSLAHSISTRGADHLRGRTWGLGRHDYAIMPQLVETGILPENMAQDPGKWFTLLERVTTLDDTIGRCKGAVNSWTCAVPLIWKYPLWGGIAKLLETATGLRYTPSDLETIADRIHSIEMAFNTRQGITRKQDRLVQKAELAGTVKGEQDLAHHEGMLNKYYETHGCDLKTGILKRERLEQLGLHHVAEELEQLDQYLEWDGPPLWPLEKYPKGGVRA